MSSHRQNIPDTLTSQYTLFQTDSWYASWLEIWREKLSSGHEFVYFPTDQFYHARHYLKRPIKIWSTLPIGCQSPTLKSIRSEFFVPPGSWQINFNVNNYLENCLKATKHQLVFPDVVVGSDFHKSLLTFCAQRQFKTYQKNMSVSYSVNTALGNFEEYKNRLSSQTRLKLYNRRKRLAAMGIVSLRNIWPDVDGFVSILNDFHNQRWGKPCYSNENLTFIRLFLTGLEREGFSVRLNTLSINSEVISVLLDVEIHNKVYNLQSGFIENYAKGLALGTIHLGYEIERSFRSTNIDVYDFMAGEGKNTNYKEKLATDTLLLTDVVIPTANWLKPLYAILKG